MPGELFKLEIEHHSLMGGGLDIYQDTTVVALGSTYFNRGYFKLKFDPEKLARLGEFGTKEHRSKIAGLIQFAVQNREVFRNASYERENDFHWGKFLKGAGDFLRYAVASSSHELPGAERDRLNELAGSYPRETQAMDFHDRLHSWLSDVSFEAFWVSSPLEVIPPEVSPRPIQRVLRFLNDCMAKFKQ